MREKYVIISKYDKSAQIIRHGNDSYNCGSRSPY